MVPACSEALFPLLTTCFEDIQILMLKPMPFCQWCILWDQSGVCVCVCVTKDGQCSGQVALLGGCIRGAASRYVVAL